MTLRGLGAIIAVLFAVGLAACEKDEYGDAPQRVEQAVKRALVDELRASDKLKEMLVEEEGKILTVYRDLTGKPTVGAGHLVLPTDGFSVGDVITEEMMYTLLENDLKLAEAGVRNIAIDLPLSQEEFDALVDLVYNVGPGNVSKAKSPNLHAAILAKDYEEIAENLIYTLDAAGRPAVGLKYRSERRRRLFKEGRYENPRSDPEETVNVVL